MAQAHSYYTDLFGVGLAWGCLQLQTGRPQACERPLLGTLKHPLSERDLMARKESQNMTPRLKGKRVAILVTDGFEQVEMTNPRKALDEAGAVTTLVSPKSGEVQGWNHHEKGDRFPVDQELKSADASKFDALLLPGGVANPDQLRTLPDAVKFVKSFFAAHKPIAAICHGPWLLVEADIVRGYKMTSWPSLKTDLTNTSRKPDDIPAFNEKMLEEFSHQHVHA
jgi:protease I